MRAAMPLAWVGRASGSSTQWQAWAYTEVLQPAPSEVEISA